MKIINISNIVVYVTVATLLGACSGNPVEKASYNKTPVKTAKISKEKPVSRVQKQAEKQAFVEVRSEQTKMRTVAENKYVAQSRAASIKPTARQATRAKTVLARPLVRLASNTNQTVYRKVNYRQPTVQRVTLKRPIQRLDLSNSFGYALSNAAIERTRQDVRYDGKYFKIGYPWGDVPKSIGVCTDVVIRSYRRLGIDLQSEVHEDIRKDFYAYPSFAEWGLKQPDPNIDHRRVYNLQAFFKRYQAELPRSRDPRDYKPGDLVTWMVGPNFPHIGVVVNIPSLSDPNRLMISHNIGAGPKVEDILFRFRMTGHYRYTPEHRKVNPALYFARTPAPATVARKQREMSYEQLVQASQYLAGL